MQNNWMQFMSNPRMFTIKKWFSQLLGDKFVKHNNVIERIGVSLTTDKDVEEFGSLIMEVYNQAYHKAVEDYRTHAEKLGLKIVIGKPEDATKSPD